MTCRWNAEVWKQIAPLPATGGVVSHLFFSFFFFIKNQYAWKRDVVPLLELSETLLGALTPIDRRPWLTCIIHVHIMKSDSHLVPQKVCHGKFGISVYFNTTLWLNKSYADELESDFVYFCDLRLFKFLFSLLFWGIQRYLICPDALNLRTYA